MITVSKVVQKSEFGTSLFLLLIIYVCLLFQYGKPPLFIDELNVVYSFWSVTKEGCISAVTKDDTKTMHEWAVSCYIIIVY